MGDNKNSAINGERIKSIAFIHYIELFAIAVLAVCHIVGFYLIGQILENQKMLTQILMP